MRSFTLQRLWTMLALLWFTTNPNLAAAVELSTEKELVKESVGSHVANHRRPPDDDELRYWLENMVWYHAFSVDEITAATGMGGDEIRAALGRFNIRHDNRPPADFQAQKKILVLPYPGGRHPRIGHQLAAIRPQRESKISVFAPWQNDSYVVVDVPEAIDSHLGLLYLAHTHVPTIWTEQGVELKRLEWKRSEDGSLELERQLPNGITFTTRVEATPEAVEMAFSLMNGTDQKLTQLRMTPCVLLKAAIGFEQQTNENKVFTAPFAACRSAAGNRWIITAWDECRGVDGNTLCPCLHSDPPLWECEPGQTVNARGWLSFYEGMDIEAEFQRLEKIMWR